MWKQSDWSETKSQYYIFLFPPPPYFVLKKVMGLLVLKKLEETLIRGNKRKVDVGGGGEAREG